MCIRDSSDSQSPGGLRVWKTSNGVNLFEVENLNVPPEIPQSAFLLSSSHTLEDPVVFNHIEGDGTDALTLVISRNMKKVGGGNVVLQGFEYVNNNLRYNPKTVSNGPLFEEFTSSSSSTAQQKGFVCSSINGNVETGWNVGLITRYLDYDTVILSPSPSPCLLYTSPSPRDLSTSRMPSSA